MQRSRKIGSRCPSTIKVSPVDGKFVVTYQRIHVGHQFDFKHIELTVNQREEIASYLSLGMNRQLILNKIRSTWTEESVNRLHLTSSKDLQNISRSFNLKADVNRDTNDLVSVESWIKEMRNTEQDPIIFYQQPEEDGSTCFMLAISTFGQRYMMEKYGENIIAIDSTHGTNDYDFQLTTVMIVDENRVGFPVAYLKACKDQEKKLKSKPDFATKEEKQRNNQICKAISQENYLKVISI